MFGALSEKFHSLFSRIQGKGRLSEANIAEAVAEVKEALLDADVHFDVVEKFIERVKLQSLGQEKLLKVTSGQQFIEIVHATLEESMSLGKKGDIKNISLIEKPSSILLCGLQGSGKTTAAAKLALYFMREKKCVKPLLVALDLARPAAIEQLKQLGEKIQVEVFFNLEEKNTVLLSQKAKEYGHKNGFDLIIYDTAGRLHVDDELMTELSKVEKAISPQYILYVANAAAGQDAVKSAQIFNSKMAIDGTILTMLDGDVRAGAALSIVEVTKKPLLFEGIGEKVEDIQPFNAQSMADRILDRGDTINLVRRMQQHIKEEDVKKAEEKLKKASFTFEDFLQQMQAIKKMGSMSTLMGMMPGMSQMKKQFKGMPVEDKEIKRMEALVQSMTKDERSCVAHLSKARCSRIAKGSGIPLIEVNKFVDSYNRLMKLLKQSGSQKDIMQRMGGMKWR
jgi:signal recognition particle subunit SRP54